MLSPDFLSLAKEWHLENIPYEILWMDEKGAIINANTLLCEQLGYSKKELLNLSMFDINPKMEHEKWLKHWKEVSEKGTVNFRTIHQRKDKSMYEVEVIAQIFSYNRKSIICAVINEITQSSFYQRTLNTSQKLAKVGGWRLNLQDQSIIATDEALNIFQVEESEMLRPVNALRYFKNPARFQEMISSAITKCEENDEVMEISDGKGELKWVRCSILPISVNDKIKIVMGVYQDVTDQHSNLLSLNLFKEIINQSEDIVLVIKENGDLLEYSESALKQLNYRKEDLNNTTIFDIDPLIDTNWWSSHFENIKKQKHFRMEWTATRKDGSQFPVDISVNHIYHQGMDLNCAILRDISIRKQNEYDLRIAFDEISSLKEHLEVENEYLQEELRINVNDIICTSKAYAAVLKQVEQVAPTNTTVLITGESGTGKELLAKALHQNSKRKDQVLVKVNCATLPKELFESELFGHKKGSFTGAIADKEGKFKIADGGTLFLDEIGEIPIDLQSKLLRVLQEREFDMIGGQTTINVDVRIITATNRNLEKMVEEGTFREDLYYRLNVFPIYNLPLRERKEDISLLAKHFLSKYAAQAGKNFKKIAKKTIDQLVKYDFPGNIRELENLIERAVITEIGPTLNPGSWLPSSGHQSRKVKDSFKSFEDMQREYIIQVLEKTNGKVSGISGAAQILKMNDKTLFAKMKKLGIGKKVTTKNS